MEELFKLGGALGGFAGVAYLVDKLVFSKKVEEMGERLAKRMESLEREWRLSRETQQQANYVEILKLIGLPHMNKKAKEELHHELQKIDDSTKRET